MMADIDKAQDNVGLVMPSVVCLGDVCHGLLAGGRCLRRKKEGEFGTCWGASVVPAPRPPTRVPPLLHFQRMKVKRVLCDEEEEKNKSTEKDSDFDNGLGRIIQFGKPEFENTLHSLLHTSLAFGLGHWAWLRVSVPEMCGCARPVF